MADKTEIRLLREAAGLSRQQVADMLETTVHHYWQVDMGTDKADPELTERAYKLLGGSVPQGGISPQGRATPAGRGQTTGPSVWVCKLCGHEETTEVRVLEVRHECPKRPAGRRMAQLVRKVPG